MLEYIYVLRHGFRSNWVDESIKTGPTGMNRDPPLAAHGVDQAHEAAKFLSDPKSLHPHPIPEKVFSSPFYRCIETALPTYQALGEGSGIKLEHGIQEWYRPAPPNTGLHPRPAHPPSLAPLFPEGSIDQNYYSTLFASRRGETMKDVQDRMDTFVEAWTSRIEEMGVRCVVVFAHAATVIALGRSLTGDKTLNVPASSASCSLYKRRPRRTSQGSMTNSRSSSSLAGAHTLLEMSSSSTNGSAPTKTEVNGEDNELLRPCGVGEWEAVYLGRTDYLTNGTERDWSFRDVALYQGEVYDEDGDGVPHEPEDTIPTGLAPGMERHLRRGLPEPNTIAHESNVANAKM